MPTLFPDFLSNNAHTTLTPAECHPGGECSTVPWLSLSGRTCWARGMGKWLTVQEWGVQVQRQQGMWSPWSWGMIWIRHNFTPFSAICEKEKWARLKIAGMEAFLGQGWFHFIASRDWWRYSCSLCPGQPPGSTCLWFWETTTPQHCSALQEPPNHLC